MQRFEQIFRSKISRLFPVPVCIKTRPTPASLPPVTVKWAITRGGCLGEVSTIGLGLGNFSVLNRWLIKNRTGLKIATDTVAYATNIFSLATKNSGLVAKVATRFLYDLDLN